MNTNRNTTKKGARSFHTILLLLFAGLAVSCGDRYAADAEEPGGSGLSLQLRAGEEAILNNTHLYMFNAGNNFVEKKLNVTRNNNILSTTVAVGTWNVVLLACDTDISANVNLPSPIISPMAGTRMWTTPDAPGGTFLSQAPEELRYALLSNVLIQPNLPTQKDAQLIRNVAKLQVILKQYDGFDPITGGSDSNAYVELLNVPTTLSWDGKLYPNAVVPVVSAKPVREPFAFDAGGVADTVNFIVPAHRGNDAFNLVAGQLVQNPAPTDTTRHKLKLRVSMPSGGQPYFGSSEYGVEIPYVPRINSITQIYLTFYGTTSLDIKIGVKPWEDWITQEVILN